MRTFNRRLHWLMASAIAIALCATFTPSASAQDEQVQAVNGEKVPAEYVSIHVDGGAMRQVLNSFAMQANRNIVIGPEVTNDLVTIHLNNVQWDNALDVIDQKFPNTPLFPYSTIPFPNYRHSCLG